MWKKLGTALACMFGLADGDAGDDRIYGGTGTDTLYGASGNDCLWGEDGADHPDGESGDDFGDGGAQTDTCTAATETQVNCPWGLRLGSTRCRGLRGTGPLPRHPRRRPLGGDCDREMLGAERFHDLDPAAPRGSRDAHRGGRSV